MGARTAAVGDGGLQTGAVGAVPTGPMALSGDERSGHDDEMAESASTRTQRAAVRSGGAGGIWFLGFLGALVYYLHTHSGTFWLVLVAFVKSVLWPAFVVYHVLALH